jgi:protein translocase SecG subunit
MFTGILLLIHVIIAIVLISLVAIMQQKHEGISGIMGGASQSSRGIKGMDEGMRKFITYMGVAFFVSCLVNSFLTI